MPAAHTAPAALMTFAPFTAADLRAQEISNVRRIADARALMSDCFARADIALNNGDECNFARESDGGERLAAEIYAAPVTVDTVTLKAVLKGMYRDSAYRGGAAVARRFGGQGTVTVYSVCLPGGLRAKVDAFGATPADRTACAKAAPRRRHRRPGRGLPRRPRHRHPGRRPPGPVTRRRCRAYSS